MRRKSYLALALFAGIIVAAWADAYRDSGLSRPAPEAAALVRSDYGSRIVYDAAVDADRIAYAADCTRRGGRFSSCGSPCSPEADGCLAVCALTCEDLAAEEEAITR